MLTTKTYWNTLSKIRGYALIEILIAILIISIVILSLQSAVSSGAKALGSYKNITKAVIISKSLLNEFKLVNATIDLADQPVKNFEGFTYSRRIEKYENPMLGPLPASLVRFTVTWTERDSQKSYSLEYIYPVK